MSNQTRSILRQYYESTRRSDAFEPPWVHPFFAAVLAGEPLDEAHAEVAQHLQRKKVRHTTWLGQPRVIDIDGWKVGTTTWIFLRRRLCTPEKYQGWTIIHAAFDGDTYWMAYDDEHPVGGSVLSDQSIGPCTSAEEVRLHIDEEVRLA